MDKSGMQKIFFERALPKDAIPLMQMAMDSHATYKYRTVPDEDAIKVFIITEEHFKNGIISLMKIRSETTGFYGLLCKEKEGKRVNSLTHCFIKPEYIGKGYGKILFKEAMRAAREDLHWEGLLWESDPNATWFYQKMGAKQIGEAQCLLNPAYKAPTFVYTF